MNELAEKIFLAMYLEELKNGTDLTDDYLEALRDKAFTEAQRIVKIFPPDIKPIETF